MRRIGFEVRMCMCACVCVCVCIRWPRVCKESPDGWLEYTHITKCAPNGIWSVYLCVCVCVCTVATRTSRGNRQMTWTYPYHRIYPYPQVYIYPYRRIYPYLQLCVDRLTITSARRNFRGSSSTRENHVRQKKEKNVRQKKEKKEKFRQAVYGILVV